MSKNFFGGFFDFNRDGKTSVFEQALGLSIIDECSKPYIPQNPDSSVEDEDPYNAADYSHPEDFYYDHYDDFFDYEDAEDYYNEHTK